MSVVNAPYTETFTNPAYPYGGYSLISTENGLYRLWNILAPPGMQEVLLSSNPLHLGWTAHPTAQDEAPIMSSVESIEGLTGTVGITSPDASVTVGTDESNNITLEAVSGGGFTVFGRTSPVTAQTGDYTPTQVGADPVGSAAAAQTAAESFATTGIAAETARAEAAEALLIPKSNASTDVTIVGGALVLNGTLNVESIIRDSSPDQMHALQGSVTAAGNIGMTGAAAGVQPGDMAIVAQTGWQKETNPPTRASNTTFTVSSAALYLVGYALKWQESSVQKYGIVLSVSGTTVTLVTTSDYVMAATPDGGTLFYSNTVPHDFPSSFTWSGVGQTGWSGSPTITSPTFSLKPGRCILLSFSINGTSNATSATLSGLPIPSASTCVVNNVVNAFDNTASTVGWCQVGASSSSINFFHGNSLVSLNWTSSGTKVCTGSIEYGF